MTNWTVDYRQMDTAVVFCRLLVTQTMLLDKSLNQGLIDFRHLLDLNNYPTDSQALNWCKQEEKQCYNYFHKHIVFLVDLKPNATVRYEHLMQTDKYNNNRTEVTLRYWRRCNMTLRQIPTIIYYLANVLQRQFSQYSESLRHLKKVQVGELLINTHLILGHFQELRNKNQTGELM